MNDRKAIAPFDETTLRTQITRRLIGRIERLGLKPGDVLGTEGELADEFGVSPRTLREAAGQLRAMGMLTSRRRVGLLVAEPDPSESLSVILPLYGHSEENIEELLRLRQVIEMGAIELAVNNIGEKELAEMEKLADRIHVLQSQGRMRESDRCDVRFHSLILKATGSKLVGSLHGLISRFFNESVHSPEIGNHADPERRDDHRAICEAFKSGRPEEVIAVLRTHLGSFARLFAEVRSAQRQLPDDVHSS